MPAEKSIAIVLRLTEFSETSLVATLYTRDFGKISALAKGARRPKSPFEAALDLLAVCRIVFLHKSSDGLDLLTEAKLERRFRSATKDLSRLYAGYYVAELIGALTDHGDPSPELFDVANQTLQALDSEGDVPAWVIWCELQTLRLVGHLPQLEACASCGRSIDPTRRAAFALLAGGVICTSCRAGQRQVIAVSQDAMEVLRRFANPVELTEGIPRIEEGRQGEVRGVMSRYISHLVGYPLRLQRFLTMF